jgi:hypothetical protein
LFFGKSIEFKVVEHFVSKRSDKFIVIGMGGRVEAAPSRRVFARLWDISSVDAPPFFQDSFSMFNFLI